LRLDPQRFVYLDVDGAPYVVRSLRWEGARAIARLSDDSEEPLACATLRLQHAGALVTVKGRFDARLSTAAWNALQDHLHERDGAIVLDAEGGPYVLR
jgi:hypothetical protein